MSAVFKDIAGRRQYQHIQCDEEGCKTTSPPAAEILRGHGLVNMGWSCAGGKHYCPTHAAAHPSPPPQRFPLAGTRHSA
jgi:hypothetical protein